MKTRILTLLALIAIALVGCQKDEADKIIQQDVTFGIIQVDPNLLKDGADWDFQCTPGLVPTVAEVVIGTTTYWPQVFYLNGKLYTQALQLGVAAGGTSTYSVSKFVLWTIQPQYNTETPSAITNGAEIVMATPNASAPYAQYVAQPVPFNVTVNAFAKTEQNIDVLCFIPEVVQQFGFFWYVIDELIVREQCFFGDLCIKAKGDYIGSYYDDIFDLDDYPFDLPAIYKVKLIRNDGWEKEFMNIDIDENEALVVGSFQAPLCVKYPDRVGVNDLFTATLSILVAQGNGWAFVEFKTWEFTNFMINELLPNQGGEVINFIVGNCNYNPNADPEWVFAPWINLPTTANISIAQNWNYLYWRLDVNSVTPNATNYDILNVLPANEYWTAFCGDGTKTIPASTFNFNIYNTLNFNFSSGLLPTYITKDKLSSVHWLINNLGTFGYSIQGLYIDPNELSTTQSKEIQDAIWRIMNHGQSGVTYSYGINALLSGNSNYTIGQMTSLAQAQTNFKPMPGQWSSVLLITPHPTQGNYYQLLFTVVDP